MPESMPCYFNIKIQGHNTLKEFEKVSADLLRVNING